jgi:energy-coupling factor transport system permease protein
MNAVVAPEGDTVRVAGIAVAPHALVPAAWIALRLAAAVTALGWMILTTSPQHLVRALAIRGMPAWLQYVLAASLAAVPEARRRAREVLEAQQCRGLRVGGGALARLRATVPLAGPLMVSLVSDAERRAVALDARAFEARGKRTSLVEITDASGERVLRMAMWVASVALLMWGVVT